MTRDFGNLFKITSQKLLWKRKLDASLVNPARQWNILGDHVLARAMANYNLQGYDHQLTPSFHPGIFCNVCYRDTLEFLEGCMVCPVLQTLICYFPIPFFSGLRF